MSKRQGNEVPDGTNEIRTAKQSRANAKRKFVRKTIGFSEMVEGDCPFLAIQEKYADVKEAFSHLEQCNELVNSAINETGPHHLISQMLDECDDYMMEIEKEMDRIRAAFALRTTKENHAMSELRVRPLETPHFSGNIRQYSSFKQDFQRLIARQYGRDPFALRQCLSGEALQIIRGVENNYDEMFRRLDDKFGEPRKIVDAVILDIKRLKPVSEGDHASFIHLVDVIERSWLELSRLGLSQEMDTTTMVTMIERLMPRTQKREWVTKLDRREDCDSGEGSKFQSLLSYLLQERRVMDYMDSDIRGHSNIRKVNQVSKQIEVANDNSSIICSNEPNEMDVMQVYNHIQNIADRMEGLLKTGERQSKDKAPTKQSNTNINCWFHRTDSHSIYKCNAFLNLTHEEKLQNMRQHGVCFNCLQPGHIAASCAIANQCDKLKISGQVCGKRHHPCLHLERTATPNANNPGIHTASNAAQEVLLAVSEVSCNDEKLSVLWDSGANISLITHRAAASANLRGNPIDLSITKVGNQNETIRSKRYLVPLNDANGKLWRIYAYGIEEITSALKYVNMSSYASHFSQIKIEDINRPYGTVDMLIGIDCCAILPQVVETVGNLQLLKNQFGYCIRGCHSTYDNKSPSIKQVKIVNGTASYINNISVRTVTDLKKRLDDYFTVDNLGTSCTPKCGGCRCGKCAHGNSNYTLQEERELAHIKQGITFDSERKKFTAHYPWIKDPSDLPNNIAAAEAKLKSTERRLMKMGTEHAEAYNEQMQDMVRRGIARKLSKEEIERYKGPVHYLQHHEIMKPTSSSTPLRIVFNSSASFMGHVLNDYWAKGPDVINSLFGILLRFREQKVGLVADISKMFNSIQLAEMDQHVHRYLWRDLDIRQDPSHYVLLAVAFGDRPSGTISMVALKTIAEMNEDKYEVAAKMITRNSYIDDLIQSVSCVDDAVALAKNVEHILDQGGFKIKYWIISGTGEDTTELQSTIKLMNPDREKILGISWSPASDQFLFHVQINFSPKCRNVSTDPAMTEANMTSAFPQIVTRRMLLGQTARIFDPLGLITPVTLGAKLLLRKLVSKPLADELGWDDPLPEDNRAEWRSLFEDLLMLREVSFTRCTKPIEAIGEPTLVIFSDASMHAYGACAYAQWLLKSGKYEARLIAAKNRIAPTRQMSIPRLELCGALLGCRLRESIQNEMDYTYCKVVHIIDSTIVQAQIQKESYGFGTFVATKVAEIQNKSDPREWWWTSTDKNPADMVTRPRHPTELGPTSIWQLGPNFLQYPMDKWPISQSVQDQDLPDRIRVHITSIEPAKEPVNVCQIINLDTFNSFTKLLRVTARILGLVTERTLRVIGKLPTVKMLFDAEVIWIKDAQRAFLQDDWRIRFKRLGPSMNSSGIIVVGQRLSKWLKDNWNQDQFILLPINHRFTYLYIRHIHNLDHAGVDVTFAKVQSKFWVPGARKVIKQVKAKCVICRKFEKKLQTQLMGEMTPERLHPSPPFYHTALDLFGPFVIRDTVKKRTRSKAYGVIFNCLASRAVYLDIVDGYATKDFLVTFRRFVTIRGYPASIHSDKGSQLVAANKELRDMTSSLNWPEIKQFGVPKGLNWTFNTSADAPWQNGCSESLIRLVKKASVLAVGETTFTAGELQTVLFEIANLLNERPIGQKPGADPKLGTYLCPNDLILGRTGIAVPQGPWRQTGSFTHRLAAIQRAVTSFWKKWQRDYFFTLIVRQKWHVKQRNLRPGDIVLVQDTNALRGQWKLAEVMDTAPTSDGKVRDVTLRYKLQTDKPCKYNGSPDVIIKRSVHRLVLLQEADDDNATRTE